VLLVIVTATSATVVVVHWLRMLFKKLCDVV